MQIQQKTLRHGYDRITCYVHARAGKIPDGPAVLTMSPLRLSGNDVFYAVHDMRSDDGGVTWGNPMPHTKTLNRWSLENEIEEGVCDLTPAWHADSGTLLATGQTARYMNDDLEPPPRRRRTVYTVYNPIAAEWSLWRKLELPETPEFFSEGAGSTQRIDLPGGEILLPSYFAPPDAAERGFQCQYTSTVMRCAFDGQTLRYIEHGTELTLPSGRGFVEPSIIHFGDRFLMTLRNNDAGYMALSSDGLSYDTPTPWQFDDGRPLGNYNTQQHWVTVGGKLYLVYNRRGLNNDHIPRYRAPLLIGEVDPNRRCVIRESERILVPERGARLGNFGITHVTDDEAWVTVSEWMQTTPPDPFDYRQCEARGSNNALFLIRLKT